MSGALQGLGAEIGFALFAYAVLPARHGDRSPAPSAAPLEAIYEWYAYWTDWDFGYKLAYLVFLTISGAVVAGGLGWLLTRGLAAVGGAQRLPPGQEIREARTV